jgi:transcriptional regulator with XRE-family HTH domain
MRTPAAEPYDRGWLVKARTSAGLTQKEAAKAAEISQSMYNYIEQGLKSPGIVPGLLLSQILRFDPVNWLEERRLA